MSVKQGGNEQVVTLDARGNRDLHVHLHCSGVHEEEREGEGMGVVTISADC